MWGWFVDAIGHRIGYYKVVQYNGSKFVLQIILIVQDERTNTICNFQIATLFHEVGVSIDAQTCGMCYSGLMLHLWTCVGKG